MNEFERRLTEKIRELERQLSNYKKELEQIEDSLAIHVLESMINIIESDITFFRSKLRCIDILSYRTINKFSYKDKISLLSVYCRAGLCDETCVLRNKLISCATHFQIKDYDEALHLILKDDEEEQENEKTADDE